MKMLTTPEVADRLGVTIGRVQQMIWEGKLPAEKVGRDYVVKETDLALVKDRKRGRPPKSEKEKKSPARKKGPLK